LLLIGQDKVPAVSPQRAMRCRTGLRHR